MPLYLLLRCHYIILPAPLLRWVSLHYWYMMSDCHYWHYYYLLLRHYLFLAINILPLIYWCLIHWCRLLADITAISIFIVYASQSFSLRGMAICMLMALFADSESLNIMIPLPLFIDIDYFHYLLPLLIALISLLYLILHYFLLLLTDAITYLYCLPH